MRIFNSLLADVAKRRAVAAAAQVDEIVGPRGPVIATPVPELGSIILYGSPADIKAVLDLIDQLQKDAQRIQPEIKIFQLKRADAAAMALVLQQLFLGGTTGTTGGFSVTLAVVVGRSGGRNGTVRSVRPGVFITPIRWAARSKCGLAASAC